MGSTTVPWVIAVIIGAIVAAIIISLIALQRSKGKPFSSAVWIVNQRLLGILLVLAVLTLLSLLAFLFPGLTGR